MTNAEAQTLIADSESKLRKSYFALPIVGWTVTALSGISGWLSLGVPLFAVAVAVGLWSVYITEGVFSDLRNLKDWKSLYLWRQIQRNKVFSSPITGLAREVRDIIEEIYAMEAGESLLPLPQSVRLFDTYVRQQKHLNPINARLRKLHALRAPFVEKATQLEALGKEHVKSPQEAQLDDEINRVEASQFQIEKSCNCLEEIVERLNREAQARQIQLELHDLSASLPNTVASEQPIFASELLEEIERQIGREIEIYRQLERETDEQL